MKSLGDALAPSSYQAVATYSGKSSYSVATGYVSTANYVGDSVTLVVQRFEQGKQQMYGKILSKW